MITGLNDSFFPSPFGVNVFGIYNEGSKQGFGSQTKLSIT